MTHQALELDVGVRRMSNKPGLIIATEEEANILYRSTLRRFPEWRISGMGKVKALTVAAELIHHYRCDSITLFGFCGGLAGLVEGDVVEPNIYIEGDNDGRIIKYNYPNIIKMTDLVTDKLLDKSIQCPMVTADQFMLENKYDFKYSQMACDMEAYAIAYMCHDLLLPFRTIKVVSDIVGWKKNERAYRGAPKKLDQVMNHALDEVSLCLT